MSDPPIPDPDDAPRPSADEVTAPLVPPGDEPLEPAVDTPAAPQPQLRPWWTYPLLLLSVLTLALAGLVARRILDDGSHDPARTTARRRPVSESKPLTSWLVETETDAGLDTSRPHAPSDLPALAAADDPDASDDDAGSASDDDGSASDDDAGIRLAALDAGVAGGPTDAGYGAASRSHFQEGAVHWRIAGASDRVTRVAEQGPRFEVWLAAGKTFDAVRVEWQDAQGRWHSH